QVHESEFVLIQFSLRRPSRSRLLFSIHLYPILLGFSFQISFLVSNFQALRLSCS
ncbi:unnamed protein product, partial [Arabidopsis halleri]